MPDPHPSPERRRWTFEEVWSAEFEPDMRAKIAATSVRRSESFLDAPLTVCGEEIRQMTPEDLLYLDGFENPFVCGLRDVQPFHRFEFIWQLSLENTHTSSWLNSYRRGRCFGRLARRDFSADCVEIVNYCDRMFADFADLASDEAVIPGDEALKPAPATHFLAPLLVSVAREIGATDPMSGLLLSQVPLPRLVQYRRASQPDPDYKDDLASLRSRCLERLNQLNAQSRQQS